MRTGLLPARGRRGDPAHRRGVPPPVGPPGRRPPRRPLPPLIDNVRQIHLPVGYASPAELLAEVADLYRRDRTQGQPWAPWLATEKDTLRTLLAEWVDPYGLPVLVLRGFSSETYIQRVREMLAGESRPRILAFIGDHDASGEAILDDWLHRTGPATWTAVERIALTHEQVITNRLPAAVGKADDPRWPAFARRFQFDPARPVQWEVKALEPAELQRLVLATVQRYVDPEQLRRTVEAEHLDLRRLHGFLRRWPWTES
ncbi:hypothetical protein [Thermomonospora amylolytica]|uniref:hypothetical protein n=1 Tax=Thermomonospora amylolytica TaxID=1411117 RepID=UPI0013007BE8|nr:hypothetical protein [Thermomonospora amylolytica]